MTTTKHIAVLLAFYLPAFIAGQGDDSTCRGISRGRNFVVGFTSNFEPSPGELHIIVVAFSDLPTTVTISSAYQVDGADYEITFRLPPGGYRRTTVPLDFRLDGDSLRSRKVLNVEASSDVTVYGASYFAFSTDAFLSLPNDQLGLHHVVASVRSSQRTTRRPLFAVIGLTDNTNVHVTLTAAASFEGQDYDAGDVLSFILGRHEIVQVLSVANTDLSGTIIRSDNPVAAIAGHQCAATPGSTCDALIEQLIPVASWGTSHIYTPAGTQADRSIYKVLAFYDGTVVSVPGEDNTTLNAGEFLELTMSGSGVILSNLPSSVTQILRFVEGELVDPSIIQVPSEEQFAFRFGFATPPASSQDSTGFFNFVNIVVEANECNFVTLDGAPVPCGDAVAIPGTTYVVLIHSLPKEEGAYFIESSSEATSPMSVIVYGYELDETYGFAAGLSLPSAGRLLSVSPFILNENGGGTLTTTLPCLEQNIPTPSNVICRFISDNEPRDVPGRLVEFYQVLCPTSIFGNVGFTTLNVSLDGGLTFPYSDRIYVAPQNDLPSRVTIGGTTPDFPLVDLRSISSVVTIQWDPSDFPDTTKVNLGIFFEDPARDDVWSDVISLASEVNNTGRYDMEAIAIYRAGQRVVFDVSEGTLSTIIRVASGTVEDIGDAIVDAGVRIHFHSSYWLMLFGGSLDCEDWLDELQEGFRRLTGLPGCPPTGQVASQDRRYELSNAGISRYHPGAADCYRRGKAAGDAATQCCYDSRGQLLTTPPGGGTADAYPSGTRGHVRFDVRPWIACCFESGVDSQDCRTYYRFRPVITEEASDINLPYDPVRPAGGVGDPHFSTLDQFEYTFNAAGEFLLLYSEMNDITFQGRMMQVPGVNASVFSAFVLQGGSMPKIQVQHSALNGTLLMIDDREFPLDDGTTLSKIDATGGVEIQPKLDQNKLVVRLPVGLAIEFCIRADVLTFLVVIDEQRFRGRTRGLLGNFNGIPDDDLTTPNGSVLRSNSSLREIHYNFGLQWAVNQSESLFRYLQSESSESINRPDFEPSFDLPGPGDISSEVADLCGSNVRCIYDAVNTGNLIFASNTLTDSQEYEDARQTFQGVVHCAFPSDFVNGRMETSLYMVGVTYTFRCRDGFTLVGNPVVHCGEGGIWTSQFPSCVRLATQTCIGPNRCCANPIFCSGKRIIAQP